MPTIYVIDDDRAVRQSLCWLFGSTDHAVVAFASAREFLQTERLDECGCIVTDVRMPGMTGLELQEELVRRRVRLPIIVITGHGDVPMAVRAMRNGAFDFVEKPFKDSALLDTVNTALDSCRSILATEKDRDRVRHRLAKLTARELEVLDLIVDGAPNKRVADRLGISEKTVEAHRARVMEKMAAKSFAELVRQVVLCRAEPDAPNDSGPASSTGGA